MEEVLGKDVVPSGSASQPSQAKLVDPTCTIVLSFQSTHCRDADVFQDG